MFHGSIALYGLLLFYSLTKDELVGRRPLSKFLAIKLIVMFTWYQSFVVRLSFCLYLHRPLRIRRQLSALSHRVLKGNVLRIDLASNSFSFSLATKYWVNLFHIWPESMCLN
jgi:hypothetical protein